MTSQHLQKGLASRRGPRRAAQALALWLAVLCGAFAGQASAAVPGLQLQTATFGRQLRQLQERVRVLPGRDAADRHGR
jgi:hypothetical protein